VESIRPVERKKVIRDELRQMAVAVCEVFNAASMPVGARVFANCAVNAAGVTGSDLVVDLGCGPGTAARRAARRGATVFGVDPTPVMLSFARLLTRTPLRQRITWLEGVAEAIPLDDGAATVALAIRSAHHFDDPDSAFKEIRRVLRSGGRVVIVERAVPKRTRSRRHGLTSERASEIATEIAANGFDQAKVDTKRSGFGELVVLCAIRP
jgi:ubiquinone/menaquinone biosynthesis C-methylase UbiE